MAELLLDRQEGPAPAAGEGARGPVLLRDRYAIDPALRLPELDSPSAEAFAVEDRKDPPRPLFALVCSPDLPPRAAAMSQIKGMNVSGLLPLVEWDKLEWPPLGQRTMIAVFERPLGGRVIDAIGAGLARVPEHDLTRRLIEPVLASLQALAVKGIPHRALRPNNLFFFDKEMQTIVLGECVTAPAGFDQPIACEPANRAMAQPAGRGVGSTVDDVYALGVTIISFVVGAQALARMSDDDLIDAKIEFGSYSALCSGQRIPLFLIEPLRGMLLDDADERWSLEQLELWVNGRKLTPMQRKQAKKASGPFTFGGRDHLSLRTLARAFTARVPEAAKLLKNGSNLDVWIRRGLSDAEMADRVKGLAEQAKAAEGQSSSGDDLLVAKVAIHMDPSAPIRYKGFSFMPDGFGPAFAHEFMQKGQAQVAADCLARDLHETWSVAQLRTGADVTLLLKPFQQLKGFLKISEPGYGIERCLYEINPNMPCQSPLVQREYADEIGELLPALDRVAGRADPKSKPLDRHIIAFIATRFVQDIHPHLKALAAPKEETELIGMLSLLAFLQWKLKAPPLLGLSSWVGGLLGPAIVTYNNRNTRREIEREIPKLVRKGSLPELFDLIDNAEKRRMDAAGYAAAQAEFATAEAEIEDIQGVDGIRLAKAERTGQQAAAMTSIVMSMIVISLLFLLKAW